MDTDARALFLQKIHLFHNLKDDDLSAIAEIISEVSFPAGAVVFEQGKKADSFYLVYSGKVRVVGKAEGKSSN